MHCLKSCTVLCVYICTEPDSSLTAVGKPVAGPTKEQLYAELLPVKKWKALAAQFKLNDDLIDEIYTNNERDEDCLEEVIRFWYMNRDFQHTWSEVVTALEAIGEHTLAEDIRAAHSQLILNTIQSCFGIGEIFLTCTYVYQ